ncbi:hypothetical protein BLA29_015078, partial [Euroglyphus maynei]
MKKPTRKESITEISETMGEKEMAEEIKTEIFEEIIDLQEDGKQIPDDTVETTDVIETLEETSD